MNPNEHLLASALAENQRLKLEVASLEEYLAKSRAQFEEMNCIATRALHAERELREKLYSVTVQSGKITAADAQITEQIN